MVDMAEIRKKYHEIVVNEGLPATEELAAETKDAVGKKENGKKKKEKKAGK